MRIQRKNRKLVLSENIPFKGKEMSPWVMKDREAAGEKNWKDKSDKFC
jgi:hypothetical protein